MKDKTDTHAVNAMLALDLPGTVDIGKLPDEIMWMPPGQHTIRASQNGKPIDLEVTVDENAANKIIAAHSDYLSAMQRNEEDRPYIDFNHDDADASGHPVSFRWAGNDPQQGGIRAKVEWTGKGKEALLGRTYRRFSPSFHVDSGGKISGAPVNMGGLVNRAAFKRIAPIVSKESEQQALLTEKDFSEMVKIVARSRNLQEHEAIEVLAHERPDLYLRYRINLGLGDRRYNARELSEATESVKRLTALRNDRFMIEARALADALDLPIEDAVTKIAYTRPATYERYRARVYGTELTTSRVAEVTAGAVESPFFAAAKSIAAARSVDLADAFDICARENPDLYDGYRRDFF